MTTRKILAITIQFELSERKAYEDRLKTAHEKGLKAAIAAVEETLLPGSIDKVDSRMTWGYRYLEETLSKGYDAAESDDIDPEGT